MRYGSQDSFEFAWRNLRNHLRLAGIITIAMIALFIGGSGDPANERFLRTYEQLETTLPGLRGKPLIDGTGHSVAEEAPDEVLRHVLAFLAALSDHASTKR